MAGKTVGVLVELNYEDMEVWYPVLRFREEGYKVITIGPEKDKSYTSKHGYPCKADTSIDAVTAGDLDALVIPGGWAPDLMRRDPRFVNLVKDVYNAGTTVAAICRGSWMLCSSGINKGKKVTCLQAIKDDVINAGGLYEDSAVVVDGNLITSRVPGDLPEFCKAILQQLREGLPSERVGRAERGFTQ